MPGIGEREGLANCARTENFDPIMSWPPPAVGVHTFPQLGLRRSSSHRLPPPRYPTFRKAISGETHSGKDLAGPRNRRVSRRNGRGFGGEENVPDFPVEAAAENSSMNFEWVGVQHVTANNVRPGHHRESGV